MNGKPLIQIEVAGATNRIKITDLENPTSCVPDKLWNDPNTFVERKLDGHREKLHIFVDGNRFDSRRQSVNGGLYVEKSDSAPHIRDYLMPELDGTILDGEMCAGSDSNATAHALGSQATDEEKQSIRYVVFDIIYFKGQDIRHKPDSVRRGLLEICFAKTRLGGAPFIQLINRPESMTPDEKKQVLITALIRGEEGVMIKDTSKPYGKGWTKVKREARFDVVITGYTDPKATSKKKGDVEETVTKYAARGWIGAVTFGQYRNGKLVDCGQTSGFSDDVRQLLSENKEAFIGRVIEISAQERFKTGFFRHPRFERFRDDKNAVDCVYREDEV